MRAGQKVSGQNLSPHIDKRLKTGHIIDVGWFDTQYFFSFPEDLCSNTQTTISPLKNGISSKEHLKPWLGKLDDEVFVDRYMILCVVCTTFTRWLLIAIRHCRWNVGVL